MRASRKYRHWQSSWRGSQLWIWQLVISIQKMGPTMCLRWRFVRVLEFSSLILVNLGVCLNVKLWNCRNNVILNTCCATHVYYSRWQKLCCCRTAHVEQFTGYSTTDCHRWKHIYLGPRTRSALWLLIIVRYMNTLVTIQMTVPKHEGNLK